MQKTIDRELQEVVSIPPHHRKIASSGCQAANSAYGRFLLLFQLDPARFIRTM
jgi:hypothetical protein